MGGVEEVTSFHIHEAIYEEIIAYCQQGLPNEVCGLIAGPIGTKDGFTLWKLPNETKQKDRFLLSERTVAEAMEEMKRRGERLTGIFHSHPTKAAYPSTMDIVCNPYPEIPYIIVSFATSPPVVQCFTMKDKNVQRLHITLFQDN